MKIFLAVAFAALVTYANAACSDIENCDTCANPGPLCEECEDGTVMTLSREMCKTCGTGCDKCSIDSNDATTCTMCLEGYYLKDGACSSCGTGCLVCHEDADAAVTCDECESEGYTRKVPETGAATCESCPSNCRTCSMLSDGVTVRCSSCDDFKDMNTRGYFLKKEDYTCKTCPSYCEKCADDGAGTGICSSCFANYTLLADSTQDTLADGEKCLKCPNTCSACSGEILSGTTAKCTECYAENGLYLSSDECTTCGTGCKSCDSDGLCTDCVKGYRLQDDACTECPAFCDTCSYNEDTSENECTVCEDKYGPKDVDSVSCDACGISNCGVCSRSADGTFSCDSCKTGYAFDGDTVCKVCAAGCDGCVWDAALDGGAGALKCSACLTGYLDAVKDDGTCDACPAPCATCSFTDPNIICETCDAGNVKDAETAVRCQANIPNCDVGNDGTPAECNSAAECASGYQSTTLCAQCDLANCVNCETEVPKCDACVDGWIHAADNTACLECTVANCMTCAADALDVCIDCMAGYIVDGTGASCIKCSSNCDACTADGSSSTCDTCSTYDADAGTKAYVDDGNGVCKSCGSRCTLCTWDSDNSKALCSTCETGYAVNGDDECEACPSNCNDCEYSSDDSAVICKDNECDAGYGKKTDKMCHACPEKCDECTLGDAEEVGDDVLICDTCSDNYALNSDVCAKCPSNCQACEDAEGTMQCTECVEFYALNNNDKTCQKCPTNCETCTAGSSVTCNECKDGYALSADKASCVDCPTAAFDNCAECTNIESGSGKANCTECDTGYTLQDEEEYLACVDTASLDCGLDGDIFDNGPECSACSGDFQLEDYICIKKCYACGDVNDGVYVEKSQCMIPSGNATENDATLVSCPSGICYGVIKGGMVAAGCLPENDQTGTCTGDRASGEACKSTETDSMCERCCEGEMCNTYLQELDGQNDSGAASMATNVALLLLASIMAMRI